MFDDGPEDVLLTKADVAELCGVSVTTISGWRMRGIGPSGVKLPGGIRYWRSEVDRWLEGLEGH